MSKEVIAIDLDDVVSSQTEALIAFSNARYGTTFTMEDFKAPGEYWGYYEQVWGVSPEEGERRFKEFLNERVPLQQVISPQVKQALEALKQRHRLEIVTARGAEWQQETIEWVDKHAPRIFDDIHFVALWGQGDQEVTKALICQEIGAGYLIDDNVEHCNLAAEAGVQALLFGEYGWNIGKTVARQVVRVKDWPAVLEYFDERS